MNTPNKKALAMEVKQLSSTVQRLVVKLDQLEKTSQVKAYKQVGSKLGKIFRELRLANLDLLYSVNGRKSAKAKITRLTSKGNHFEIELDQLEKTSQVKAYKQTGSKLSATLKNFRLASAALLEQL